jgi:hypothetical protein
MPVDAVYPAKESEWTAKMRSDTEESLGEIRKWMANGQKRRWNCRACGHEQEYKKAL